MNDDIDIINFRIEYQRANRNKLLLDSDKYVLPDYPISPENLIIIKEYRQTLRDIMATIDLTLENPFPKFPF
jgi:hypothetical protein